MTSTLVTPILTTTTTRFDAPAVVDLAEAVERDGLDAHTATLSALATEASAAGVSPVLVDVMLGTDEPYVARLRAFVRVGLAAARHLSRPTSGELLAA